MHYCGSHPEVIEDFFKIPNPGLLWNLIANTTICWKSASAVLPEWSYALRLVGDVRQWDWLPRLLSGRVPAKKILSSAQRRRI